MSSMGNSSISQLSSIELLRTKGQLSSSKNKFDGEKSRIGLKIDIEAQLRSEPKKLNAFQDAVTAEK